MLGVKSWRIHYADGSTFTSSDGTWAEAPPFGVQCVVYYHTDDRITLDGGSRNGHVYMWRGEDTHPDYQGLKMGLWMDRDGYYRVCDLETLTIRPEV